MTLRILVALMLMLVACPNPGTVRCAEGCVTDGDLLRGGAARCPQSPERREPGKLLVDSGPTYPSVAAALLRALPLVPRERRRVVTIEGQVAERDARTS